ncbi:MAG: HAD family phosphatase [Bacteroidota bacterium]|nr:HAD family phosphatase [Bacteroidota bacterium]
MYTTIIFDLGGVLIDWNSEYLYRKIFSDEKEMKRFLARICTPDWNEEQDAGRLLHEATETLIKKFSQHDSNIRAFYSRWKEMLGGAIEETVEIFEELQKTRKYKLYALTNWSAETFPIALDRFPFLHMFDGIMVSGKEKIRKPFPQFYQLLLDRYGIKAKEAIFIDDNTRNVEAAIAVGIDSIIFTNAKQLKRELTKRKIL